jgi:hypothetical protein
MIASHVARPIGRIFEIDPSHATAGAFSGNSQTLATNPKKAS